MKNKRIAILGTLLLTAALLGGCAGKKDEQGASADAGAPVIEETVSQQEETLETECGENEEVGTEEADSKEDAESSAVDSSVCELADGVYEAEFDTDNSMFRVCEALDGKGTLTVENGKMTIHVSLGSKNIVNLYYGLAEDAKKEGAVLLEPTLDPVTYSDGWQEEVYGFDIPVPVIGEEFDVALIGKKGKWYDHKVIVSNPTPMSEAAVTVADLTDGAYTAEITFEGGSGKAEILSPVTVQVNGGKMTAVVQWNSPNYDYMIVDGETYLPVNEGGDSVFEIPVSAFDEPLEVIGDTVAMSKPHEIEYTITIHSDSLKTAE